MPLRRFRRFRRFRKALGSLVPAQLSICTEIVGHFQEPIGTIGTHAEEQKLLAFFSWVLWNDGTAGDEHSPEELRPHFFGRPNSCPVDILEVSAKLAVLESYLRFPKKRREMRKRLC